MGHEYVELKNTHAAIEAYRRAVDVNRRDYRAWYGLGQTYEVLSMHAYALWYFKRACGLRPWDSKMWAAVGSCLQKMGRDEEGIKALKRALMADMTKGPEQEERDARRAMDTEVCLQIAGMYERLGDEDEAKGWMELTVAQEDGYDTDEDDNATIFATSIGGDSTIRPGGSGSGMTAQSKREGKDGQGVTKETSKARMWLAKWAMRHEKYELALTYAMELCTDGYEVEEAKSLVRDLRARGVDGAGQASQAVDADEGYTEGLSTLLSSP